MIKIFITGATGFVGRNVLSVLKESSSYEIFTPRRTDLNLMDESSVVSYLKENEFDVVLHFAQPSWTKNSSKSSAEVAEEGLRIFMNLCNHSELFGRMIYTGSGAEFDKSMDMNSIGEECCRRSIPSDSYGFSKMIMNHLAENSKNIYNFRIFGCFGPYDAPFKFITHCIRAVLLNVPITIRKDCKFDYLHVFDFARFVEWGFFADLNYHSYNVTSGYPVLLSDIAKIVLRLMNSEQRIKILSSELNKNYTASNNRIIFESGMNLRYTLEEGIAMQIEWEKKNWSETTVFDGE